MFRGMVIDQTLKGGFRLRNIDDSVIVTTEDRASTPEIEDRLRVTKERSTDGSEKELAETGVMVERVA